MSLTTGRQDVCVPNHRPTGRVARRRAASHGLTVRQTTVSHDSWHRQSGREINAPDDVAFRRTKHCARQESAAGQEHLLSSVFSALKNHQSGITQRHAAGRDSSEQEEEGGSELHFNILWMRSEDGCIGVVSLKIKNY